MKVVTDENSERVARYAFEYGMNLLVDLLGFSYEFESVI